MGIVARPDGWVAVALWHGRLDGATRHGTLDEALTWAGDAQAAGVAAPPRGPHSKQALVEIEAAGHRVTVVDAERAFAELARAVGRAVPTRARRSIDGLVERLELLHAARLRPERSVGGVGILHPDDLVDATVVAWIVRRPPGSGSPPEHSHL